MMNSEIPVEKDFKNISEKPQSLEFESLLQENSYLKAKIQQLESDYLLLKQELQEIAEEKAELLSILADFRRDKTITAYTTDSYPKNHLLVQEFLHLKNQDFQLVSFEIFDYGFSTGYFSKANRKQDISKIQAIFSKEILINGANSAYQDNTVQSNQILDALVGALDFCDAVSLSEKLLDKLQHLIEKGVHLVYEILTADPPGELWIEAPGTTFDADQHEAVIGCEETGEIAWTVYPGYRVGNRIFAKAIVFTT